MNNYQNTIEEDIISQLSKDSSIDYEEQNNVEASFDYNNEYEDEFSDDGYGNDEDDDEDDQPQNYQKEQTFVRITTPNTFKSIKESHILSENRPAAQKNEKNGEIQEEQNIQQNQNSRPVLQYLKGICTINETGQDNLKKEIKQQSEIIENNSRSRRNNNQSLQNQNEPISVANNVSSFIDLQSSRNNSIILNQKNYFTSTSITTTNTSKQKSVISFEINKRDKKTIIDPSINNNNNNNTKQKFCLTDNSSANNKESIKILFSPRDSKALPNIDKIKAKFTKLKQQPPSISSRSWVIVNGKNKKLISGKNENQIREIASLTKMMTCYIVVHYIRKLDLIPEKTYFRVSAHAASQPGTSAELNEGELVSIMDLLYGMMLPSGNDAAFILAENFGVYMYMQSYKFKEKYKNGNTKKKLKVKNPITYFIKEMNKFAEKFNMQDTYFTNPHGLMHKKNRSTSYDVGLLAYQLIYDPLIRTIISSQSYKASIFGESMQVRQTIWKNTNKLLKKNGFIGMKTGITNAAGPCLVSWYKNQDANFIIVLLGAKSTDDRWNETIQLVEWTKKQLNPKRNNNNNKNNISNNN